MARAKFVVRTDGITPPPPRSLKTDPKPPVKSIRKIRRGVASRPSTNRASFLDLAPELRNNVYKHLLTSPDKIRLADVRKGKLSMTVKRIGQKHSVSPSILATCHQIHNEAAGMLYGSNLFSVRSGMAFEMFLKKINHSVKLLRHIKLEIIGSPGYVTNGLYVLRHAKVLETLEFGWSVRLTFLSCHLAEVLAPMMKTIAQRRGDDAFLVIKLAAASGLDVAEQVAENKGMKEYMDEVKGFLVEMREEDRQAELGVTVQELQ